MDSRYHLLKSDDRSERKLPESKKLNNSVLINIANELQEYAVNIENHFSTARIGQKIFPQKIKITNVKLAKWLVNVIENAQRYAINELFKADVKRTDFNKGPAASDIKIGGELLANLQSKLIAFEYAKAGVPVFFKKPQLLSKEKGSYSKLKI